MISTGAMVRIGKAYHNLMVDVVQSNAKLQVRAENIVMEATGVERDKARETIDAAGGSVKTAITMILADCEKNEALALLEKAHGRVRDAVQAGD